MKKLFLMSAMVLMVSIPTFAGGLLTNTNQNAAFLRNPARDAVIAIDGVYSNPAGIAFLPQGFHLSLSWQAAFQKREITSTAPYYPLNPANNGATTKEFVGESKAPVIPSFQVAYVFNDKWSVSAQFAIGGGGGKCEFDNGLGMFEGIVYKLMSQNANAAYPGATIPSYSLNQQITGEQYVYAFQLGGTYKLADAVSVFAGVRTNIVNFSTVGSITDITGDVKLPESMGGMVVPGAATAEDLYLDCSQSDVSFAPILGVDVNLGKLNLAAKYEFRSKVNLENDSENHPMVDNLMPDYKDGSNVRADIPALLTLGAQYSILPSLRINGGYHLYFDKDAKGGATAVTDNTWEASLGAEWDINKKWLVSFGVQRTQYGFDDADMSEASFNIRNTSLGLGAAYQINDKMKLNVGYYHTFYEDHDTNPDKNGLQASYTRKNDVVGVSLDIAF